MRRRLRSSHPDSGSGQLLQSPAEGAWLGACNVRDSPLRSPYSRSNLKPSRSCKTAIIHPNSIFRALPMESCFSALILVNGLFAMSEIAVVSSRKPAATMGGGRQGGAGWHWSLPRNRPFPCRDPGRHHTDRNPERAFGEATSPHPWRDVSPRSQSLRPILRRSPGHHRIGHHNPVRDSRRARPKRIALRNPEGIAVTVARRCACSRKLLSPRPVPEHHEESC